MEDRSAQPEKRQDAEAAIAPGLAYSAILALSDIKLAHSVFAMPFAVLGAFMSFGASGKTISADPHERTLDGLREQWPALVLIVLCMFFARTWAMLVNRLADRGFDERNPRTARRVFASGALDAPRGWMVAVASAGAFIACCAGFWLVLRNPWPLALCVPVLGWIALYSYTKRFTALCHVFLGGALAASPIAASIAIAGLECFSPASEAARTGHAILLLAGFVLFWVAGFDVAYALQDIAFDRGAGLHSIPAKLGPHGALHVSRAMHVLALVCLALASRTEPRFGLIFMLAGFAVFGLLIFEHAVLARRGVAGLPLAFFTLNGCISLCLGGLGVLDLFVR